MWRFEGLPKLSKSGSYGFGQLLSTRSRLHSLRSAHKQGVLEASSQSSYGVAEGGLAQPNPFRGAPDMALVDERFESEQEIEVDPTDIHGVNCTIPSIHCTNS